ncbi:MAG: photosynthetic complex assembly protein PuhC [Pseudomonadota bacterium]
MESQTSSLANQMKHRDRDMVPKFLVQGMFALMLGALALVSYAVLTDRPLSGVPTASPIVNERMITLVGSRDRAAGVAVLDESGTEIAHSTKNKSGFIDVIWVSLTRERVVQRVDVNAPIRLVRREDGHVVIIDPSTDWTFELIGYGKDNVAAFARLID